MNQLSPDQQTESFVVILFILKEIRDYAFNKRMKRHEEALQSLALSNQMMAVSLKILVDLVGSDKNTIHSDLVPTDAKSNNP